MLHSNLSVVTTECFQLVHMVAISIWRTSLLIIYFKLTLVSLITKILIYCRSLCSKKYHNINILLPQLKIAATVELSRWNWISMWWLLMAKNFHLDLPRTVQTCLLKAGYQVEIFAAIQQTKQWLHPVIILYYILPPV